MLGGGRARAGAGARRPLSRDSKVGGQGEEGLGGACARIRGAGLETHRHRRGHKLGTCVTLGAHGTVRYFGSPRVPSAGSELCSQLVVGLGGFAESLKWSDAGSSACPLEGRAYGRGHRGASFPRRGAFGRHPPGGVS